MKIINHKGSFLIMSYAFLGTDGAIHVFSSGKRVDIPLDRVIKSLRRGLVLREHGKQHWVSYSDKNMDKDWFGVVVSSRATQRVYNLEDLPALMGEGCVYVGRVMYEDGNN